MPDRIDILGVRIDPFTVEELHSTMGDIIDTNQKAIIANVNVHAMNLSYNLPWFRSFLSDAKYVFCDGYGVVLGARLLGYSIPERVTYADWIWQLAYAAETNGWTIFFLGAKDGVAEKASKALMEIFPDLKIVGCHHGYFEKRPDSSENATVIEQINSKHPNILIVGFGMPLQEHWLNENWAKINANVALTGGAVFDYASGELKRGPDWMTQRGLEWLARLFIEPIRLWRRYLIGNPLFIWRVLKSRLGLSRDLNN
jgi:N-acetylglucosaminyldiphosphoundecaprenol N-acetyl-beta-D-mannosaminyltransferase